MRAWMVLCLVGCASEVAYMPVNPPPRELFQRASTSVELFTASPPRRDYVEVGTLFASSPPFGGSRLSPWVTESSLIKKLRKEAGEYGCDALVVAGGGSDDRVRGTCIVWR
jgi:hypothetical protein